MELLLLSNSTLPGEPFFQWPQPHLVPFLQGKKRIAFIPFAATEDYQDTYVERMVGVFGAVGCETIGLHRESDPAAVLDTCDTVAIGGGNSFLLLRSLYRTGLIKSIVDRVKDGMPFLGWSAGSNVTCPTIMTTNDMPIVEPPSLKAMHLVPFQINPHYLDPEPGSRHMGETREERLRQFHEEHHTPVLGLREGCMLRVEGDRMELRGTTRARLFLRGTPAKEYSPPCDLSFLLAEKKS